MWAFCLLRQNRKELFGWGRRREKDGPDCGRAEKPEGMEKTGWKLREAVESRKAWMAVGVSRRVRKAGENFVEPRNAPEGLKGRKTGKAGGESRRGRKEWWPNRTGSLSGKRGTRGILRNPARTGET